MAERPEVERRKKWTPTDRERLVELERQWNETHAAKRREELRDERSITIQPVTPNQSD